MQRYENIIKDIELEYLLETPFMMGIVLEVLPEMIKE